MNIYYHHPELVLKTMKLYMQTVTMCIAIATENNTPLLQATAHQSLGDYIYSYSPAMATCTRWNCSQ